MLPKSADNRFFSQYFAALSNDSGKTAPNINLTCLFPDPRLAEVPRLPPNPNLLPSPGKINNNTNINPLRYILPRVHKQQLIEYPKKIYSPL